jgi:TetR/AcrR family transcriptional regulator, cholesterol catabolism regulator
MRWARALGTYVLDNETPLKKSEVTRESILRAAAVIFAAEGYSTTRLTDVAARIGMKAGSLYYHFDSRESLIEAILERGMNHTQGRMVETLAALPANADPLERLRAAIECHFTVIVEQEEFSLATVKLFNQIPDILRQRHVRNLRIYAKLWRQLLKAALAAKLIRADISPSIMRMTIVGALNSATGWFRAGKLPATEVGRQMSLLLLHGLAVQPQDGAASTAVKRRPSQDPGEPQVRGRKTVNHTKRTGL